MRSRPTDWTLPRAGARAVYRSAAKVASHGVQDGPSLALPPRKGEAFPRPTAALRSLRTCSNRIESDRRREWLLVGDTKLAIGLPSLDELGEFSRLTLEGLRQGLKESTVKIARAAGTLTFPAATAAATAVCDNTAAQEYKWELSGPLLDRIDSHVTILRVSFESSCKRSRTGGVGGDPRWAFAIVRLREAREPNFPETCRGRLLVKAPRCALGPV